jgi:hypothetical protein
VTVIPVFSRDRPPLIGLRRHHTRYTNTRAMSTTRAWSPRQLKNAVVSELTTPRFAAAWSSAPARSAC